MNFDRIKLKGSSSSTVLIVVLTAGCFVILMLTGMFIWIKNGGFNSLYSSSLSSSKNMSSSTNQLENAYTYLDMANTAVNSGNLILVNGYYEYKGDNSDIVSIYENKNDNYSVSSYDDKAKSVVIDNLNALFTDFVAATGKDDVNIISAFRTRELQQQLFDEGDPEYVAKPGYSEHETGYAVDFGIYNGEWSEEFDGTGEYEWIQKNCFKYGFILRYPQELEDVTQINYEPWHFRYVGKPHAYYIMQNNISLEQYSELVRRYPFNGEHLIITDYDGIEYEIYYITMDNQNLSTQIPVPSSLNYTISGDNINGFIVTVENGIISSDESASDITESDSSVQ